MRKKLLLEQNIQLFDRLTAAEGEIKRLKNELEEEKRRAAALKEENNARYRVRRGGYRQNGGCGGKILRAA